MGSIAKYHSRQTLSKNEAVKFKYQDAYLQESIHAELRAKSYTKAIEKERINSAHEKRYEKGRSIMEHDVVSPNTTKNGTSNRSGRKSIQNPTLLAKKRVAAWKRKKQKEDQRKMQIQNEKWYHVENRPIPTIGDIDSVKRRAKIAIKRIKDERARKEKMNKIKHKTKQFKKKILYSEAQRIISSNVGKFEKGSYIIRLEDRRKTKSIDEEFNKPSWQPTGYYNDIEVTQNTKKMEESYENKKGIYRTFSYP